MRRSTKRVVRTALAAFAVCIILLGSTSSIASAAEFRSGETVTIGPDEKINDDLYISGSNIVIDGTVTGDVFALGERITINGNVGGSVNAAGGSLTIAGTVGKAVRIAGGTLIVGGDIGGDLLAMGSDLKLGKSAVVGGDAILGTTKASLDGTVGRNVNGSVNDLTISGTIGGNVDVEAATLSLKDGAIVQGNVTYTSNSDAHMEPGSEVGGQTTRKEPAQQTGLTGADLWWRLLFLLWAFVVGAALVLLAPRVTGSVADIVRARPLTSVAFGILALILTPVFILILAVTIIGLPLAGILLVAYLLGLYLAQVFVGLAVGEWIVGNFSPITNRWGLLLALVVGLIVLAILNTVPVPGIGFIVQFVTAVLGLGALAVSLSRLRSLTRQNAV